MKRKTKSNLLRLWLYVSHFTAYAVPNAVYRLWFMRRMARLNGEQRRMVEERTQYYCRLPQGCSVSADEAGTRRLLAPHTKANEVSDTTTVGGFTFPWRRKHKFTLYFFDLYHTVRMFPRRLRLNYFFGDIIKELPVPTLAKTRPVNAEGHSMSVLCKLDSFRHFNFITDGTPYLQKKDMIVFRNVTDGMPWRQRFLYMYASHPLGDIGHTNHVRGIDEHLRKPFLSQEQQLQYKFIACIEGNDVATNLKWVMSSNSIAVMPRPTRESWYMEGALIPNYHYIEIKADYSDLPDRLQYYIQHPDEAMVIIEHAHEWVAQFLDSFAEDCVQHTVVQQYFAQTHQL